MIETYGGEYLGRRRRRLRKAAEEVKIVTLPCARLRDTGLFGCRKYSFLRLQNAAKWRKDILFRRALVRQRALKNKVLRRIPAFNFRFVKQSVTFYLFF